MSILRRPRLKFTALSAAGKTAGVNVRTSHHTVQLDVTGSPTTVEVKLEGSLKRKEDAAEADWYDLSGTVVASAAADRLFHVVNKPVHAVRVNLVTLSGGSSPTVTCRYEGRAAQ